jgi:hypothetical protein
MPFSGSDFIAHVATRLVNEFAYSAEGGTPVLIGSAKEHPARVQLERLMPDGVGVGSGIVIDSYGGTSKQQDIVIFEKICPIFSINGSPEATYYPIEGVIAVGEVKSSLGKSELNDAFEKSVSVKKLRRYSFATDDSLGCGPTVNFRNYTEVTSFSGTKEEEYDQDNKSLHQVFTFILCEKFESSAEATLKNYSLFCREFGSQLAPNFVASLNDGTICPHNSLTNSTTRAAMEADGAIFSEIGKLSFSQLLKLLRMYVSSGKTVDRIHFERYFADASLSSGIAINSRAPF